MASGQRGKWKGCIRILKRVPSMIHIFCLQSCLLREKESEGKRAAAVERKLDCLQRRGASCILAITRPYDASYGQHQIVFLPPWRVGSLKAAYWTLWTVSVEMFETNVQNAPEGSIQLDTRDDCLRHLLLCEMEMAKRQLSGYSGKTVKMNLKGLR